MGTYILGISAYYHDSAAAIIHNGEIIAAAHEERFTRKKHDPGFPSKACQYVMDEANIVAEQIEAVVFYDKPFVKFERLLETYHAFAPKGLSSFATAIPVWIKEKLFLKQNIRKELKELGFKKPQLLFPEHHLSHAASAFYPSPFDEAAILTVDGVGEWATTTICHGKGKDITIIKELHFPHSLGLLYSAFTYYTGFVVNSGEYKLMGLAPYGNPDSDETRRIKKLILDELVDLRPDGSLILNMKYFSYATGLKMVNEKRWEKLFGFKARKPSETLTQSYMNMALAIQQVTEEAVIAMAESAKSLTGATKLVMAGGVALNSVANGKLLQSGLFEDIWIQPAAGDAGGAVGAALCGWHLWKGHNRVLNGAPDGMKGAYLGPDITDKDIQKALVKYEAVYSHYSDFKDLCKIVAEKLDEGNVVGWVQGRMEYGPRALGNRSILGDARNPEMQKKMNLKIKYREGFRPFAPSVLEEDIQNYFDIKVPSPYMLMVVPVQPERLNTLPEDYNEQELMQRLYFQRSDIPAVTHVDYSARLQSVNKDTNSRYWELINTFKELTDYGVIVNTSFNVRGEPIVCDADDAYRCFMRTEMDYLVIGNYLFEKTKQKEWDQKDKWQEEFKLD
ncbi:carbamoyltransferase family protein [Carboxylicivirga linearis]|uniref:Carbamoyltransferase n=1 Tax=Carboxylicivirga linearis TaxID=1628157 RepID=A0ABS5JW91_9BACT|nr:carbamoyltransferase [Carboxylicivirga linearis]MBS2099088.1 carbamoyltransferase [Carboxylicivirga linearis]